MEPFAYAIQAPIGSVVPLFHRRKDAEAYIAKLTDSREEAKIILLYRGPTLTAAERESVSDMCEFAEDFLGEDDPNIATLRGLLERIK